MTDHLIDNQGRVVVNIGDEVENEDVRFFVGGVNESQRLCHLDKTKPWELKNKEAVMAICIRSGNYSACADSVTQIVAPECDNRCKFDPDAVEDYNCTHCPGKFKS